MSKNYKKYAARVETGYIEVKSKFDAEFRRFSVNNDSIIPFDEFLRKVSVLHGLVGVPLSLWYTDPKDGDLLPINNDDNYSKALQIAKPLLRLHIQRKGDCSEELNGIGTLQKKKTKISTILATGSPKSKSVGGVKISLPEDFRRVSAIIDVDIVPETHRRVKLLKHGSDKPLGFYIRDGTSVRVTPNGLEKVPGIFISRLVPGGLAESTGLLAVNDEVLEVNGIEVAAKTLDQVTDMMVANSSNLIITVKPVNQRNTLSRRGSASRSSQMSAASAASAASQHSHISSSHSLPTSDGGQGEDEEDEEDEDVVKDYLAPAVDRMTTGTTAGSSHIRTNAAPPPPPPPHIGNSVSSPAPPPEPQTDYERSNGNSKLPATAVMSNNNTSPLAGGDSTVNSIHGGGGSYKAGGSGQKRDKTTIYTL